MQEKDDLLALRGDVSAQLHNPLVLVVFGIQISARDNEKLVESDRRNSYNVLTYILDDRSKYLIALKLLAYAPCETYPYDSQFNVITFRGHLGVLDSFVIALKYDAQCSAAEYLSPEPVKGSRTSQRSKKAFLGKFQTQR